MNNLNMNNSPMSNNTMPNMQMMMQFMNMMNNVKPGIIDPKKIAPGVRKNIVNQNITQSKIGLFKKYPNFRPVTFSCYSNYSPGVPNNICEVKVTNEHVLDIAENYAEKGVNFTPTNKMSPVILNTVGKEFSGTNFESSDEIRDQVINMRTSFNNTVGTNSPYPTKDTDCVYSKSVTIIRPKNFLNNQFLPYPQTYRTAMITTSPIKCTELLSDNKMNSIDYIKTLTTIECVFQAAIAGFHPILILSPFGYNEQDNNPTEDIIKIYNYCIFKYGHRFKEIIVGIPPFLPKQVFDKYSKEIIKPQDMVAEIETKYDQEELKNNLLKKSSPVYANSIKQKSSIEPEQMNQFMQMMMNMMKQNNLQNN